MRASVLPAALRLRSACLAGVAMGVAMAAGLYGPASAADLKQPPATNPPEVVILRLPPVTAEPVRAPVSSRFGVNDQLIGHGDPYEAMIPGYLEGDLYVRLHCRANPIRQASFGRGNCNRIGLIQSISQRRSNLASSLGWSLYGRRSLDVIATGCYCVIDDN